MSADTLLRVANVHFRHQRTTVLEDVSLGLEAGEVVTVVGPNGAGKTTLIRIVLGILRPDQGQVWIRPGTRIGYVPQRLAVDPTLPLSVHRFVALGGASRPDAILAALAETGAERLADTPVQQVSGGEMQRVLLARALLRNPELLVLDEPVQAVDVVGQYELYDLIAGLRRRRHCGVLLVSHDLHLVMAATDQVLCLNGHVCCSGPPERVSRDPSFLRLFGHEETGRVALYHHQHDHRHDHLGTAAPAGERDA